MSRTSDVTQFNPKRWSYMAAKVEEVIRNEWSRCQPTKLQAGVMIDLERFMELALKGLSVIPADSLDYECWDLARNVILIAQKVSPDITPRAVAHLFKQLENFLCVLKFSKVPITVLGPDAFFQRFFTELHALGS